jgi:hypothetical protein
MINGKSYQQSRLKNVQYHLLTIIVVVYSTHGSSACSDHSQKVSEVVSSPTVKHLHRFFSELLTYLYNLEPRDLLWPLICFI